MGQSIGPIKRRARAQVERLDNMINFRKFHTVCRINQFIDSGRDSRIPPDTLMLSTNIQLGLRSQISGGIWPSPYRIIDNIDSDTIFRMIFSVNNNILPQVTSKVDLSRNNFRKRPIYLKNTQNFYFSWTLTVVRGCLYQLLVNPASLDEELSARKFHKPSKYRTSRLSDSRGNSGDAGVGTGTRRRMRRRRRRGQPSHRQDASIRITPHHTTNNTECGWVFVCLYVDFLKLKLSVT